jgi:diguanylate cyclase (GGDEF)-like protein
VAAIPLPHETSELGYVTISVGAASMEPSVEDAPEALVARADAALYQAKADGRNRVKGS